MLVVFGWRCPVLSKEGLLFRQTLLIAQVQQG